MSRGISRFTAYLHQRQRGWQILMLMVVCVLYLPFWGSPFVFDDITFFRGAAVTYANSSFHLDLRWFPYATLGRTYSLFGGELTHVYHIGNLLLHFANVVLLFHFVRHLLAALDLEQAMAQQIDRGAALAALIFALHPVAVYAVGYTVQRSILMATMFSMMMAFAYLRGLIERRNRWFVLATIAYFLACFSKEHSVLMPLILAAMGVLVRTSKPVDLRMLWATWGGFLAIALLITLRAKGVLGTPYEPMAAELFEQQGMTANLPYVYLLSVLTQTGLFFKYLLLLVMPNVGWMSVDMREQFIASLGDVCGWLGALSFLTYGALSLRLLLLGGLKGLTGLALLYPWLLFGVELSSVRVQEPFVLYRAYLWMPGLMLLAPALLLRFKKRATLLLFAGMLILFGVLAWNRLWVFADNYRLWNDAALLLKSERVNGADRIYFNRGQASMDKQDWEKAASDFERTIAISPRLGPPHRLLADAYFRQGLYPNALEQYDLALAYGDDDAKVYFYRGVVLKLLHRPLDAKVSLELGCRKNYLAACLLNSSPQRDQR